MEAVKIILLSILAAILYGIAQDQVTARVCVEYFTVGHRDVFGTDSPTLLAFGWGVLATWWAGLLMGLPLAVAARVGPYPKRTVGELIPTVGRLLLGIGAAAAVCGVLGYFAARAGLLQLNPWLASEIPAERHALFLADGSAHSAAYAAGFLGGAVVCLRTWRGRLKAAAVKGCSP
ncbi:MAG: hypothetical protein ACK47B_07750 [Armatimonadota bacterium]